MRNRPAETGGVAAALALLIGYIAGINDPALIVALGVVIGFIPAAITWLVEQTRGERGQVDTVVILLIGVLLIGVLLLAGVRI